MTNRIRNIVLAGVSIAGLALALSGCAGGSNAAVTQEGLKGQWTDQGNEKAYLDFDGKGGVSGSDGCNRIISSYTIDGDNVTFSKGLSTLMACEGVDAWLGGLNKASVDGNTMVVKDASGSKIGELERASKG